MAYTPGPASSSPVAPPVIYRATRASGPSGAVIREAEIEFTAAVAWRQSRGDVVVCGDDVDSNRNLARTIEAAVGPYKRSDPHIGLAGPMALPHFQQIQAPPEGHTFYETARRKAKNKP